MGGRDDGWPVRAEVQERGQFGLLARRRGAGALRGALQQGEPAVVVRQPFDGPQAAFGEGGVPGPACDRDQPRRSRGVLDEARRTGVEQVPLGTYLLGGRVRPLLRGDQGRFRERGARDGVGQGVVVDLRVEGLQGCHGPVPVAACQVGGRRDGEGELHADGRVVFVADAHGGRGRLDRLLEPAGLEVQDRAQGLGQGPEHVESGGVDEVVQVAHDTVRLEGDVDVAELLGEEQVGVDAPHRGHVVGMLDRSPVQGQPLEQAPGMPVLVRFDAQGGHGERVRPGNALIGRLGHPSLRVRADHGPHEQPERDHVPVPGHRPVQLVEGPVDGGQRVADVTPNECDPCVVERPEDIDGQ
ncbi:hypothetical protein [Streptomyces sp. LN699]|uniref:hypothetical protein n=1 Tax=Streptomyces sp. LN699 TaxID=3112981 RepID=UPI00370F79AE